MRKLLSLAAIFLALLTHSFAKDVHINVKFIPSVLSVGEVGDFEIIITGTQQTGNAPTLPDVEGLRFLNPVSQKSVNITNGNATVSSMHKYSVYAKKAGEYTVPSFNIIVDGMTYETKSAKLSVYDGNGLSNNAQSQEVIYMKVNIDKEKIYVGEMIPIDIKLYVRQGIRGTIAPFPVKEGDAFNSENFQEKGKQQTESVNGNPYETFTWKTYIMPLKSGIHDLSYTITMAIQKSAAKSGPTFEDFLRGRLGSFMDDVLGTTEESEVHSKVEKIHVLPLPEAGKPEAFTGAVGEFALENPSINPQEAEVGEPIIFKYSVKGVGNFPNITPPELKLPEGWKAYKPKVDFNPEDAFSTIGTKTFEYVLIPQSADIKETPHAVFNSFNPETGQYQEMSRKALPIKITPSTEKWNSNATINTSQEKGTKIAYHKKPKLLPIKLTIKRTVNSLEPIFKKQWFLGTQVIPLMLIAFLYLHKKRKIKLSKDLNYIRQIECNKALQKNLSSLKRAYAKGNLQGFYDAGVHAICESVGRHHEKSSKALTLNEIDSHLRNKNAPSELIQTINELIAKADHLKFSGSGKEHKLNTEDLKEIENLIKELEQWA